MSKKEAKEKAVKLLKKEKVMKTIKAIDVDSKAKEWASTKEAVVEVALAAVAALAEAHKAIIDECGQVVNSTIEVKKGSVSCDLCKEHALLTIISQHMGSIVTSSTPREHWRGELREWQALARELTKYTSTDYCYKILIRRL